MPSSAATELPRINREQSKLSSGITEVLRRKIIDGSLSPGARISEEWVSREMDMSRGPVREALRELENEGLVVVQAYRRAVVSEITTEELREVLIPVRFILEREACLKALPAMTETNFETLERLVEEMRGVAESQRDDSLLTLADLDASFHEYIVGLCGQYHTLQLWKSILPRICASFFHLGSWHQDLKEIADEHKILLNALRTGDPAIAISALEIHICTTQLELLNRAEKGIHDE
jgi:DNA-binding GntR family transcriptional regulator